MKELVLYAIISIKDGIVHLATTFNPDASEPIQIENYGQNGWFICQHCPLLRYAFWATWSEWNGLVPGSIYLTDNQSPRQIRAILSRFPHTYVPSDIPSLKDGAYLIVSQIQV